MQTTQSSPYETITEEKTFNGLRYETRYTFYKGILVGVSSSPQTHAQEK